MPTDTERREVAERLREKGIRFYSPSSWDALGEALGIDGPRNSDTVCARLTDLIEPCDTSQGRRDTVACDRDALLGLSDNLDSSASMLLKQNDLDPNRKRRGMRRDHAQSLMAASGRIREALGVVDP